MRHLRRVNSVLAALLQGLCGAACIAIAVLMFSQVLIRYFGEQPLNWSEELIRYLFVWAGFLGAALAQRFQAHVVLDLISASRANWALALRRTASVLFAVFLLFVLVSGVKFAQSGFGVRSVSLDLPMGYVYIVVPVSAVIMLMFLIEQWSTQIRE